MESPYYRGASSRSASTHETERKTQERKTATRPWRRRPAALLATYSKKDQYWLYAWLALSTGCTETRRRTRLPGSLFISEV